LFNQGIQFLQSHPYMALSAGSIAATWVFNNILTVLVSELPAPTKDSTPKYIYWFKVANTIIGNLKRAHSTAIEQSPNWKAAADNHVQQLADSGQIVKNGL
jgi:hypothetical protein